MSYTYGYMCMHNLNLKIWRYNSVVEQLLSMREALDLILDIKKGGKGGREGRRKEQQQNQETKLIYFTFSSFCTRD